MSWEKIRIEGTETEFNTLERIEDIAWKKYIKLIDEDERKVRNVSKNLIKRKLIERK
jgi:hypothetical protein